MKVKIATRNALRQDVGVLVHLNVWNVNTTNIRICVWKIVIVVQGEFLLNLKNF